MNIAGVLGLDDRGRRICIARIPVTEDTWHEVVVAIDTETNEMQVIRDHKVERPEVIEVCRSERATLNLFGGRGTLGVGVSPQRGVGKSHLVQHIYGSSLSGVSLGSLETRLLSYDCAATPRKSKRSLANDQGHVNRKPQPNKGPLGRRDWK